MRGYYDFIKKGGTGREANLKSIESYIFNCTFKDEKVSRSFYQLIFMGAIIQPICTCGFDFKVFFMGGGMRNFTYSCEVPFHCVDCETLKIRNLFKSVKKCSLCKETEKLTGEKWDSSECERCQKLLPPELKTKFKCGKCKGELVMYGVNTGYFDDRNLDFEQMRKLEETSHDWSYTLDRTYFLPYESNYCPKCKQNNLRFEHCGNWD